MKLQNLKVNLSSLAKSQLEPSHRVAEFDLAPNMPNTESRLISCYCTSTNISPLIGIHHWK